MPREHSRRTIIPLDGIRDSSGPGRRPMAALLRRLVFGRPIASDLADEHRLRKILALPIFSSDALSSVAYATQEILATLLFAGAGLAAFYYATPIAFAI